MPTPYQQSDGGAADANGNYTQSKVLSAAYWLSVYATVTVPGSSPSVGIGIGPLISKVGSGGTVVLGPLILHPGDQAAVQVIGATPGGSIAINWEGWQGSASDGSDLAGVSGSVMSAVAISSDISIGGTVDIGNPVNVQNNPGTTLQTTSPMSVLGTIPVNPTGVSQTFSQNFTLPTGTQSLLLLAAGEWAPPTSTGGDVHIVGTTTNIQYAFLFPPDSSTGALGGNGTNYVNVAPAIDPVVTIGGAGPGLGTGLSLTVVACATPQIMPTDFRTINGNVLSQGQDQGAGGTSSVPMVPAQFYAPAPWQAAYSIYTHFQTWPAGATGIINPGASDFIRLFSYWITTVSQPSGIELWLNSSLGQLTPTDTMQTGTITGSLNGLSLGAGNILSLENNSGVSVAATVIVTYTVTNY